jgi:hypothetical protein
MFIFKRKFTYLAGSNIATEEFFFDLEENKKVCTKKQSSADVVVQHRALPPTFLSNISF